MHLLGTDLVSKDTKESKQMLEIILSNIINPNMINVSGIRSLDRREMRFKPTAYHNGKVWLWNNGEISIASAGIGLFGVSRLFRDKTDGVVSTLNMYPEMVPGDEEPVPHVNYRIVDVYDHMYQKENRIDQPPQRIQGWTVASVLGMHGLDIPICAEDPALKYIEEKYLTQLTV
jgi:glycogen debranching enzyme